MLHYSRAISTDHTTEQLVWSVAPNKVIDCVFSSVIVSAVKRYFFYSNVVIWLQWEQIWKAGVRHPLYLERATFPHYGRFVHNTNLWIVIPLFQLPSRLVMSALFKICVAAILGSIVLGGKLFTYDCLCECSWHKSMNVREEDGRRERTRKSNDSWHVEHPSSVGKEAFFSSCCVCVFLTVWNAINLWAL